MKTKMAVISFLLWTALCFSSFEAFALGGHGEDGKGFPGGHLKWVLAQSGVPLTDEQKTQIKVLFQQNRDQMRTTRTALFQARRDLRTSLLSAQQTDDQIKGQVDDTITPLLHKLAENRAVIYNQIVWNVLTAEQRAALQTQAGSRPVQP